MILVVSGIRDLASDSHAIVREAVLAAAETATEVRLGGALGVDELALGVLARCKVMKVVYLPFSVQQQPRSAQGATLAFADIILQMRLGDASQKRLYHERNLAMLLGHGRPKADKLLAFTDGRATGGTAATIRAARKHGIEVESVRVASTRGTLDRVPGLGL